MDTPRIGIVGGNGWIGGALARALVARGVLPASRLTLSCRSASPGWLPDAAWTNDNRALAEASEVVILSVRPQDWRQVSLAAEGKLVISVMAGVPLADIAARTGADRVVRALPNAAAEVGFSYTPWTASPGVTDADRALVARIFAACGTGDEVPREADIDYLTGHSGTGPAYPALLAAAMTRDAVAHGIPEEVARRAALGILIGTGRLFEKTGEDPADTVAAFVDYRGVTAAAIEAMRAAGFDAIVGAGLAAALKKSETLNPA
ncbi:MAG: pyrroline-5-carboxylate reductase dimerization domain-containing protein [Amaricoccus sp.]